MAEMRSLWHKIDPTDENPEGKDWHLVPMHAIDAAHALEVDPDHWKIEKPEAEGLPAQAGDPGDLGNPTKNVETEQ